MDPDVPLRNPTILQRLDLALAAELAEEVRAEGAPERAASQLLDGLFEPSDGDAAWISGVFALRGMTIRAPDVRAILAGEVCRYSAEHQEHALVLGMHRVLATIREAAGQGLQPDGRFLEELFRMCVRDLARFRNNVLRKDQPWDGVLYQNYPPPDELPHLLATLHRRGCYRDARAIFQQMHPVRQGFRVMYRILRIAPFPDFNQVMAWVVLNSYLLAHGYPLLPAEAGDRELLAKLVGGPPPTRMVQLESRLHGQVEALRSRA